MKILVLSDTHGYIDKRILHYAKIADQVWHAGDIGNIDIINKINEVSKLKIVYGNIDSFKLRIGLKKSIFFKVEKFNVFITHIYKNTLFDEMISNKNLDESFSNILVCGHSHILKIKFYKNFNTLLINPGAIGKNGFHKQRTMVSFDIKNENITNMNIIDFGSR
tara:strand:- start:2987 stop:3478 length:492 start_codon:yes stop_codon:yes gene_type:complete